MYIVTSVVNTKFHFSCNGGKEGSNGLNLEVESTTPISNNSQIDNRERHLPADVTHRCINF